MTEHELIDFVDKYKRLISTVSALDTALATLHKFKSIFFHKDGYYLNEIDLDDSLKELLTTYLTNRLCEHREELDSLKSAKIVYPDKDYRQELTKAMNEGRIFTEQVMEHCRD